MLDASSSEGRVTIVGMKENERREGQVSGQPTYFSDVVLFICIETTCLREYLRNRAYVPRSVIIADTDQVLFYYCPTARKLLRLIAQVGNGRLLQASLLLVPLASHLLAGRYSIRRDGRVAQWSSQLEIIVIIRERDSGPVGLPFRNVHPYGLRRPLSSSLIRTLSHPRLPHGARQARKITAPAAVS